ncbi:MAG TPA: pantoate--beta-alanine ligase [Gemmatimonadaceae bacterium]|nr:pantoate--beta-alanine ligase [Gemmatimonadaceae bacterium]
MQIIERIEPLRLALDAPRRSGKRIALVPTLGALHEGHLALIDLARARAEIVVMSLFVNPLQFGPNEDFARYPRDREGDARLAESRGTDFLFAPQPDELYRSGRAVTVTPISLASRWDGAARPGHFTGVLTVVAKLFNIVQPDVAIFGQKDIQQATLIRAMVRDLDFPIQIVVAPTVREPDGVALSSRNAYLSPADRKRARVLSRAIFAMRDAFDAGETSTQALETLGNAVFAAEDTVTIEYLAVMDPETLEPTPVAATGSIIAIAGRVGTTRLIDNVILGAADSEG